MVRPTPRRRAVPLFLLPLLVLALACGNTVRPAAGAEEVTFYVSPAGKDVWSGRLPSPAIDGTDGPLATPAAAVRAARSARAQPGLPRGTNESADSITVLLREGTYELAEPLLLTAQDSGASAGRPFTIGSYPGEKPVLSGGRQLQGWKPVTGRTQLWESAVPPLPGGGRWNFHSLFVNGTRAIRARTPNAGSYFRMAGPRLHDPVAKFHFHPGDIKPGWTNEPAAEVVVLEKWVDFRHHIRSIHLQSNLVVLSTNAALHTRENNARYYIENTLDSLDAPGEWHLDPATSRVLYWPRPGESLERAELIAPRLGALLMLQGDAGDGPPLRHLVLRGLTFSFTDWAIPDNGYTDMQAAVWIRGQVRATHTVDSIIEDCRFIHLGGYALELGAGCQRMTIVGNEMTDLAAGGIRLGEERNTNPRPGDANRDHVLTDNHIQAIGRVFPAAVGILIEQSGRNRIAHNHVHDTLYTAISVGWNWGYQLTPCVGNVIEFNHLHDIGQSELSDLGAVYTLGPQPGCVIRNNLIHDVNSHTYGGWGLYADEGSSGILWENNVVYRCKTGGFHQHYGETNVIRNNIFAFAPEHQIQRTREEPHLSFFFTNNIVYYNAGRLLAGNWNNHRFVMNGNIYHDTRRRSDREPFYFGDATLQQWRARGHDTRSLLADPLFVAPAQFDFRLRTNSPALALGFKPIDLTTVGVRPPSLRETR